MAVVPCPSSVFGAAPAHPLILTFSPLFKGEKGASAWRENVYVFQEFEAVFRRSERLTLLQLHNLDPAVL